MVLNGAEIVEKQTKFILPGDTTGRRFIVFEKGEGTVLTDVDGKKYIDCHGGYSVTNIGYCHPRVVKKVQEQIAKIWHVSWDYYLTSTALLAEKISQITPGKLTRTMFVNSGAEAVENAVKLAKKYVFKKYGRGGAEIVALNGSFHGRTSYSMSLTGQNKIKKGLSTYVHPGVVHAPAPYCYRCFFKLTYPECGLECAKYMEDVIKYETADDVAAFISEPIFGEGGIVVPPDEYLPEVVKIFRQHNALYIADEIQTGFGRTGKMFAVELFNVEPDIMTVAKGIASGLPIAATITRDDISETFVASDHWGTYGGNAVMCVGALENINVLLEEELVAKGVQRGKAFMEGFEELAKKHQLIGEIRGKGLMLGLELVRDRKTKEAAREEAGKIRTEMEKRGVLVNIGGMLGNVIRIQPPLCITEEQVKIVLTQLDASMKAVS